MAAPACMQAHIQGCIQAHIQDCVQALIQAHIQDCIQALIQIWYSSLYVNKQYTNIDSPEAASSNI